MCNPTPLKRLKETCRTFLKGHSVATTDPVPCTARESSIHFTSNKGEIPVNEGCSPRNGQAPSAEDQTLRHTGAESQSKGRRRAEENKEKKRAKRSSLLAMKQNNKPGKAQSIVDSAKELLEDKLAIDTNAVDGSHIDPNCKRYQPFVHLVNIGKLYLL